MSFLERLNFISIQPHDDDAILTGSPGSPDQKSEAFVNLTYILRYDDRYSRYEKFWVLEHLPSADIAMILAPPAWMA